MNCTVKEEVEDAVTLHNEFMECSKSLLDEDCQWYHGFEIPARGVLKLTKRCLGILYRKNVVKLECDDGLGQLVRQQLIEIAQSLSISYSTPSPYELVIWTNEIPTINC